MVVGGGWSVCWVFGILEVSLVFYLMTVQMKADNEHDSFSVGPVSLDGTFAPTKLPSAGEELWDSIGR